MGGRAVVPMLGLLLASQLLLVSVSLSLPLQPAGRLQVQGLVDRSTQGQDLTELCLKLAKDDQKMGMNMDMALAKPIDSGL
jgi:hypothetical protein